MIRDTIFSPCFKYRYLLWREWSGFFSTKDFAMFICLNPSTADEIDDDPTVRRCINFAKNWGYGAMCLTNLFAFKTTYPYELWNQIDPIGPENDEYLINVSKEAKIIIAAWGVNEIHRQRDVEIRQLIPNLYYLKLTKNGDPCHPLYLPKKLKPKLWIDQ